MSQKCRRLCLRAQRWSVAVAFGFVLLAAAQPPAAADDVVLLQCGQPVLGFLGRDEREQEFQLRNLSGVAATVVIDVADSSGTLDLLKLRVGDAATCNGSAAVRVRPGEDIEAKVSDCIGRDTGQFVITASVVSGGPANCAKPLPCGSVPFVRRFGVAGETQAYSFLARAGDSIDVWAGRGLPRAGEQRMRLRLFGPDGRPLGRGDSCGGQLSLRAPVTGQYTVLVSACGKAEAGVYWLAFDSPACPSGPEITYLGLASASGSPIRPDDYDAEGRPIYRLDHGSGFILVIEGKQGRNGVPPGLTASRAVEGGDTSWPDLQVLVSRPLGDGNPALCDVRRPNLGGVPASPTLEFLDQPGIVRAANDFGCRVDDGTGNPLGRSDPEFACTSFPDGSFHFVAPGSNVQFCAVISAPWAFRPGQTIVKARLRDEAGNVGWPREMIVEVAGAPPPVCVGDCNGDGVVTVDEVVLGVRAALGEEAVSRCAAMDRDTDGTITIDEILLAVTHALAGCPQ